jgi:diguanylate cyclase (GGDEF)-like protein
MASSISQNTDSNLKNQPQITAFRSISPRPAIETPQLFKLTSALQFSLDTSEILTLFFKEVRKLVALDSISYVNDSHNIKFKLGIKGTHMCCYKLTNQSVFLGEICFSRNVRFREHELANVESLLSCLIFPIKNSLTYADAINAAFKDVLTGASNRIAMNRTLPRELALAHRHNIPLAMLMIDLDHFKQVNDNFGHLAGDAVLQEVVLMIQACIRHTDICYRYGGEEFCVLLHKASEEDALDIAERIRESVENMRLKHNKNSVQISLSVGISYLNSNDYVESLLERADEALYVAKNNGRNQVQAQSKAE